MDDDVSVGWTYKETATMITDTDAAQIAMDVTDDKAAEMTCAQYDAESAETPVYCPTCGRVKTIQVHPSADQVWTFCATCLHNTYFQVKAPVVHYSAGRNGHGKYAPCGAKVWKRHGFALVPSTSDVERVTCPDCLAMSEAEHEMMAEVYNS